MARHACAVSKGTRRAWKKPSTKMVGRTKSTPEHDNKNNSDSSRSSSRWRFRRTRKVTAARADREKPRQPCDAATAPHAENEKLLTAEGTPVLSAFPADQIKSPPEGERGGGIALCLLEACPPTATSRRPMCNLHRVDKSSASELLKSLVTRVFPTEPSDVCNGSRSGGNKNNPRKTTRQQGERGEQTTAKQQQRFSTQRPWCQPKRRRRPYPMQQQEFPDSCGAAAQTSAFLSRQDGVLASKAMNNTELEVGDCGSPVEALDVDGELEKWSKKTAGPCHQRKMVSIAFVGVFLNGIAVTLASFAPVGEAGGRALVKELLLDPRTPILPNNRYSAGGRSLAVHMMVDHTNRVYSCVTARDVPTYLAFSLLDEVQIRYLARVSNLAFSKKENAHASKCQAQLSQVWAKYERAVRHQVQEMEPGPELEKGRPANSKASTSKDDEEESTSATVIIADNAGSKTDRAEIEATELPFTANEAAAVVALQFHSPAEETAVAREISFRSLSGWAGWKRKCTRFRERCLGNRRRVKMLQ